MLKCRQIIYRGVISIVFGLTVACGQATPNDRAPANLPVPATVIVVEKTAPPSNTSNAKQKEAPTHTPTVGLKRTPTVASASTRLTLLCRHPSTPEDVGIPAVGTWGKVAYSERLHSTMDAFDQGLRSVEDDARGGSDWRRALAGLAEGVQSTCWKMHSLEPGPAFADEKDHNLRVLHNLWIGLWKISIGDQSSSDQALARARQELGSARSQLLLTLTSRDSYSEWLHYRMDELSKGLTYTETDLRQRKQREGWPDSQEAYHWRVTAENVAGAVHLTYGEAQAIATWPVEDTAFIDQSIRILQALEADMVQTLELDLTAINSRDQGYEKALAHMQQQVDQARSQLPH